MRQGAHLGDGDGVKRREVLGLGEALAGERRVVTAKKKVRP
jgi:hypothetical protein